MQNPLIRKIKIDKLIKVKELIDKGLNVPDIVLITGKSERTIQRYCQRLRDAGYKVELQRGRPRIPLE